MTAMREVRGAYIAFNALVSAEVELGAGVSIWFSAAVRGDVAPITIGAGSNVQDCAVVHCDHNIPNDIGENVVIGHSAVVHGRRVGSGSLIGIGAQLLGRTEIGEECLIAAGAVVSPGTVIPRRSVVMGIPGRVVRGISEAELEMARDIARRYQLLAADYAAGRIAFPYDGLGGGPGSG